MKFKELVKLVEQDESDNLEFKKSLSLLKAAAESLCAFLNNSGGIVLIGVTNTGKILGQDVTDRTKQEIANILRKFEPTANVDIKYIKLPNNSKHVVMLQAHPEPHSVPYAFDGRAFERKESSTNLMPQSKYQQLLLKRNINPVSWESQIDHRFLIEDLDKKEILQTASDIAQKKRLKSIANTTDLSEILTRLELIDNEMLTRAAIVLFAKEIPGDYKQCILRMARFRGLQKTNKDIIDMDHIDGNAFQLLRDATVFIDRNTSMASRLEPGNLQRTDEPEYPPAAIREALINAICHRDYSSLGGSITICIYDDRLEIASFGLLLPDITVEKLTTTHASCPRNRKITNAFFRRGYIEAIGIGTQEIVDACKKAKMRNPEFYEQAGCFVVRFWSKSYVAPKKEKAEKELTERQQRILTLLMQNDLASREILNLLPDKVHLRTLRKDLEILKGQDLISSKGKGPKTKWTMKSHRESN